MNFNALKITLKIQKKNEERSRSDTHTWESTSDLLRICKGKIPATVNEKIVIKC